ncbi:MAG: DUF4124 domain-containing protein, partial [Granulosicoccus sp.]
MAKLLLKATIPLLLIAGMFTYGVYMKGGDPSAMWKNAGSGVVAQFGSLFSGLKEDAGRAAATVSRAAEGGLGAVVPGAFAPGTSSSRKVMTWKDDNGVTHFGTVAPVGVQSTSVSVNPDQNVLAPVKVTEVPKVVQKRATDSARRVKESPSRVEIETSSEQQEAGSYSDPAVQDVADQLGGELPGVVGKILSSQSGDGAGSVNPKQLI